MEGEGKAGASGAERGSDGCSGESEGAAVGGGEEAKIQNFRSHRVKPCFPGGKCGSPHLRAIGDDTGEPEGDFGVGDIWENLINSTENFLMSLPSSIARPPLARKGKVSPGSPTPPTWFSGQRGDGRAAREPTPESRRHPFLPSSALTPPTHKGER